jgi:predicted membrane GTPase involved in stress response
MRPVGYEKILGKGRESVEGLAICTMAEFLGSVTQLPAARKGRMTNMHTKATGCAEI